MPLVLNNISIEASIRTRAEAEGIEPEVYMENLLLTELRLQEFCEVTEAEMLRRWREKETGKPEIPLQSDTPS